MSITRRSEERSHIDMILAEASGVVRKAEVHGRRMEVLLPNMRLKQLAICVSLSLFHCNDLISHDVVFPDIIGYFLIESSYDV